MLPRKSKEDLWKMLGYVSSTNKIPTKMKGEVYRGEYCPAVNTLCALKCENCDKVPDGEWVCVSCAQTLQDCSISVTIHPFYADHKCAICTNTTLLALRIKINESLM